MCIYKNSISEREIKAKHSKIKNFYHETISFLVEYTEKTQRKSSNTTFHSYPERYHFQGSPSGIWPLM